MTRYGGFGLGYRRGVAVLEQGGWVEQGKLGHSRLKSFLNQSPRTFTLVCIFIFQGVRTEHSNTKGPLGSLLDVSLFPANFCIFVQFSNGLNEVLQPTNTAAPVQSSFHAIALPYLALFKRSVFVCVFVIVIVITDVLLFPMSII